MESVVSKERNAAIASPKTYKVEDIAKILSISRSSAYNLVRGDLMPSSIKAGI